jgi:hypothetical protein
MSGGETHVHGEGPWQAMHIYVLDDSGFGALAYGDVWVARGRQRPASQWRPWWINMCSP